MPHTSQLSSSGLDSRPDRNEALNRNQNHLKCLYKTCVYSMVGFETDHERLQHYFSVHQVKRWFSCFKCDYSSPYRANVERHTNVHKIPMYQFSWKAELGTSYLYPLHESNLIQPTYKSVPLNSYKASYVNKSSFVPGFGDNGIFVTYIGDYINLNDRCNSTREPLPIYIGKNDDSNDLFLIYAGNSLKQIGSLRIYRGNDHLASFDQCVTNYAGSYNNIAPNIAPNITPNIDIEGGHCNSCNGNNGSKISGNDKRLPGIRELFTDAELGIFI
ncbi:uncharacterized protein ASCRUDRAFT_72443 [Ascoidea rubescens DSM 1968]|uniref:C2H2-type domain-containing protein n=1 Tax=Ascoidea rubescens DSM 1968 TaxID=1344418 RepID=A0A1D2VAC9_9ASCO|nr:hypothetical protein ASCRUDRAFT_72443 [Ascoidea rubescens DSM 1968]ODV58505.1 hypothetical protein ASCRUDRAFT_72443 [Ascoidea rubescens DSM 1968]